MIVYGDVATSSSVADLLQKIAARLRQAAATTGTTRHDLLVAAFIEGSGLAQGLIDAEFEAAGADDLSPLHAHAMSLLRALAGGLARDRPQGEAELATLALAPLPASVKVRTPEGYAFYAVYPEAYLQAAASYPWAAAPLVIGLRSIGVGLAALVGHAAGADRVISLRPVGPPFARELRLTPNLRSLLATHAGPFAVVDEGPGLSGSSFGCVADLLEELGVASERIVFLPSHANDLGPNAHPRHRARWRTARRLVRTLDDLLAKDPIGAWFSDVIGETTSVEDLAGGAWRRGWKTGELPPVYPTGERRKFRLTTGNGRWLARFAGLGAIGESKFRQAQALHAAGFTPRPMALRRGFLLERWEDGRPLPIRATSEPGFLDHLGAYIAFRARNFPAAPEEGASLEALHEMASVNVPALLGEESGRPVLERLLRHTPRRSLDHRIRVDAKLQAWEWLRRPDGSFCKLDALDHARSHDLIGCQEVGWDIAGATAEFQLSPSDVERLCSAVAASGGRPVDLPTLPFFGICYAAFHGALWSMAAETASPAERARTLRSRAFYQADLARLAASDTGG